MRESNLSECPFCGEPAEMDTQRGFVAYNFKPATAVAIYCTKCPADMTMGRDDYPHLDTEHLVAILTEAWNKRNISQ